MSRIRHFVRDMIPVSVRDRANQTWGIRWLRQRWRIGRVLQPTLRRQLSGGKAVPALGKRERILVPLLQTNHYQYYQILILAKALQLRGHEVKVLLCDSVLDGCEVKNIRDTQSDPCLTCRINRLHLVDLYGLDCARLSELVPAARRQELRREADRLAANFPVKNEVDGVDIVRLVNDSVTRHCYGDTPDEGTAELRLLRARYAYSALIGVETVRRVHHEWQPTMAINDMGVYADWGPYAEYFKRQGIPYNVVSMSPFTLDAVMLNFEELYTGTLRFDRWVASRSTPTLGSEESTKLDGLVAKRFAGSGDIETMFSYFDPSASDWIKRIDRSKTNVFLFSNVFWDIGLNYEDTLFPDVVSWVLGTVEALADQPGLHLYVKPHPAEVFGTGVSRRSVTDMLRQRFPVLPANVSIIPPELKIKTYDLFPFVDIGIVYNGTLGLELLLKNIPTVVAGLAPYTGLGLSVEPKTLDEYRAAVRGGAAGHQPDTNRVRLFAYFYFVKAQLTWRLTPRAFADDFAGYTFDNLDALAPGRFPSLDHLCDAILRPDRTAPESWSSHIALFSAQ